MTDLSADPQTERRMNRIDLITGGVFAVLGLAIVYLSWTMPRLEMRGIHPATVPGLVPGLLGLALAFCGVVLGLKAYREGRGAGGWSDLLALFRTEEAGRFCAVAGLALVYALVLVGRLPFWLASAAFVFAFIVVFETWLSPEPRSLLRSTFLALVQGVIVGVVVTLVFQYGFLVRLP
ncbi:tripartite tricarboxylate transporter TctB family protein [Chelativorans salis]|uniref:Tripartite tricarboxylate transporter TctB family protein n=1 Tax=Chelativorans salis TaxID=2978478 RepID=A0ABT2LUG0_9HYPH|nr:tripartite tricarboxylate transporter TctB family protein [Chelativorans sp. EGI FJ00035]MCT7377013.1 tripartite tricarboxylate transporter TctB family protein [Chelativorans sp. EGI FJ00035]